MSRFIPAIGAVSMLLFYNEILSPVIFQNNKIGEFNIPKIIGAGIAGALGVGIGHSILFILKKLK